MLSNQILLDSVKAQICTHVCVLKHPTLKHCATSRHSLINQAFEVLICCWPQATQKRVSSSATVDKTASCRQCTMLFLCWQSHCSGTNLIMWWELKQRDLDSPSNPHSSPGSGYTPLFKLLCMTWGMWIRSEFGQILLIIHFPLWF